MPKKVCNIYLVKIQLVMNKIIHIQGFPACGLCVEYVEYFHSLLWNVIMLKFVI